MADPGKGRGRGRGRGRGITKNTVVPKLTDEHRALFEQSEPEQFDNAEESSQEVSEPPNQFQEAETESSVEQLTKEIKNAQLSVNNVPELKNGITDSDGYDDTEVVRKPIPQDRGVGPSISPARSQSSDSKLNPNSNEFVPSGSGLNVDAPVFIPRFLATTIPEVTLIKPAQNVGLEEPLDDLTGTLTVSDIMEGFIHKSSGEVPLLTATATMLLEASLFPATFDTHLSILSHLMERTPPTSDVIEDLVEMLVTWGIGDPHLRYTAIKMCDYLCKLPVKEGFRPKLFIKLQDRYTAQKEKEHYLSEEEISELVELAVFMAEMFYRVRVGNDQVVWVLGSAVFELMFCLLNAHTNEAIVRACNILKLTGYLLQNKTPINAKFNPHDKMETILAVLRHLAVDTDLRFPPSPPHSSTSSPHHSHTAEVIMSVLKLWGKGWGIEVPTPFIPMASPDALEAPVQNKEEWEQYVDETGNVIEGVDYDEPAIIFDDQDDPNIDEEIMREYENFVQDLEDHLMMQEFGQT